MRRSEVDSNEMDAFLQKLPITLSAAERGAVRRQVDKICLTSREAACT